MARVASTGTLLLTLALASLISSAGCSTAGPRNAALESRFDRYLSLPNSKALAVAGDLHGHFVAGMGYGWLSTGLAIDKAFEECNVRRKDLQDAGKCHLYAVDSQIVAGNPELEARYGRR